jgi:type VI secretion system protein ImpA
VDIETLLRPISDSAPCGEDLSFSNEFDTIAQMRREDDPTLPQGEFVTELKVADWRGVADLCELLLATRSKDLRVAGWLVEAWTHLNGFAGLADALGLLDALCERHWPQVHPQLEDGDLEQRIGNLAWALGRAEHLARVAPILQSEAASLGLVAIEAARTRTAAPATAPGDALAEGSKPLAADDLGRIQRETPRAFLTDNLAHANRALAALNQLQATLDALLGDDAPGFVAARRTLESAVHSARRYAREGGALGADAAEPDAAELASQEARSVIARVGASSHEPSGPLQTRAQALQQLRAVAEFFRRTEPHSPVAYLADKAAQWGEMTLHDWLRAVMKAGTTLEQLEELLGVKPPPAA